MRGLAQTPVAAVASLVAMSLLWGSAWIVYPLLAPVAQPFAASAFIFGVAACTLTSVSLILRFCNLRTSQQDAPSNGSSMLLGILMLGPPTVLLTLTRMHHAASSLPLLYACLPLGIALAEGLWLPVCALAVGAVLILLNGTVEVSLPKLLWTIPALGAIAMQGYALRRASVLLPNIPFRGIVRSVALQCWVACGLLAVCSMPMDASPRLAALDAWHGLPAIALLLLAIPGTALSYCLLYALLASGRFKPFQIATTQWLQFLITAAESAYFARVVPPAMAWVAAMVLLGCLAVVLAHAHDQTMPAVVSDGSAAQ